MAEARGLTSDLARWRESYSARSTAPDVIVRQTQVSERGGRWGRGIGASPQRAAIAVALLFGSRARGDNRLDSDVDVAVLGDVDRPALSTELSRATGHEVDVVDLADPGYPLLSVDIASVFAAASRGVGDLDAFAAEVAQWVQRRTTGG
jgi:predicted nucleotidyltransferase